MAPIVFEKKERSLSRGLRLPESLDQRIKELAKDRGISENLVIVSLLKFAFEEMDREQAAKRK